MRKAVAIHQPNYIPWLGYFHKMAMVDQFILLDDVAFSKGSVTNRNLIKTAQGPLMLTVPVDSGPLGTPINRVGLPDRKWSERHVKSICQAYGKAPFFKKYYEPFARVLRFPWADLAELNFAVVEFLRDALGISTPLIRSSALGGVTGQKTDRLIQLLQTVNADFYLSGTGARKYNDQHQFDAAGITLGYQEFRAPIYPQVHGAFVPNLSALDYLFNCGPAGELLSTCGSCSVAMELTMGRANEL